MCNPFGIPIMTTDTTYNALNYDMIHGGEWGSMNILWNQLNLGAISKMNMFTNSYFNNCGFVPYSGMGYIDNIFGNIMNHTLGQFDWQCKNQYGQSIFGADGKLNFGNIGNVGFNGVYNWGNYSYGNSRSSSSSSSKSEAKTAEEKEMEKKTTTIEKFLDKFAESLSDEDKKWLTDEIKEINDDKDLTIKDKYEAFQNLYRQVKEQVGDEIKEFIKSKNSGLATNSNDNGKAEKNNVLYDELRYIDYDKMGNDYEDAQKDAEDLKAIIDSLNASQRNLYQADICSAADSGNSKNFLAVISYYNSKYDHSLIEEVLEKEQYDGQKGEKGNPEHTGLKTLINGLVHEAKANRNKLEKDSKTEFDKLISKLEGINDFSEGNYTNITKAFNELYAATRIVAAKYVEAQVVNQYKAVDEDIFKEGMFTNDIKADLKQEKGMAAYADAADNFKISVKQLSSLGSSAPKDSDLKNKKVDDQIASLKENNYIEELSDKQVVDGEEMTVYEEKEVEEGKTARQFVVKDGKIYTIKKDGEELKTDKEIKAETIQSNGVKVIRDRETAAQNAEKALIKEEEKVTQKAGEGTLSRIPGEKCTIDGAAKNVYQASYETNGYKKLYYVKDGKLVELENLKYENGEFVNVDTTKTMSIKDVNPATIKAEAEKVADNKKKEERKQEIEKATENAETSEEKGAEFTTFLRGYTNEDEHDDAYSILEEVVKDNSDIDIIAFMKGFYDNDGHEGIIELMDDEYDDGKFTLEIKKQFINKFLGRAKKCGLENTSDYKTITRILERDRYTTDIKDETFNHGHKWSTGTWVTACFYGLLWGFADQETDNERIDDAMAKLYKKIVKIEKEQAQGLNATA